MTATLQFDVELPEDLARFKLPQAVQARLQGLLDRQDSGQPLTDDERLEAEGLVEVAELLTLLRLRAEQKVAAGERPSQRPVGLAAGEFTVPDDFDAPLPEDVLRSFEGR